MRVEDKYYPFDLVVLKRTIEEIGWKLHPKGQFENWDGLVHYFLDLTDKNIDYEKDKYVYSWEWELLRAMKEL